jgi:hypothetical protein
MKYLLTVFIAISCIWFLQPKEDLYLLYEESPNIDTKYKVNVKKAFFTFKMFYEGKLEQRLFLFEIANSKRDTLCLETLNSLDVKNYNWLQESFIEYYQFNIDPTPRADKTGNARYYNLNKFYNKYIVKIDSSNNKAILYKVKQDYYTDYEGWNIQPKDTTHK